MFFWFKPTKIVTDVFCVNEDLADLFAIQPARYPKVMTDLPGVADIPNNDVSYDKDQIPTIKQCPAIRNLYNKSFSIRAWAQYDISVRSNGEVHANSTARAESHHKSQWGNAYDGMANCKLVSPWLIKERTGIMWNWTGDRLAQRRPLDFLIVDGIMEFRHQHGSNVNLMLPVSRVPNGVRDFRIMAGESLVLLTPLTEKSVEIKTHVITQQEYNTKVKYVHSQFMNYDRGLKIRNEQGSKCPFHF